MREKARAEGRKPKYDGCCREKNLGPGKGRVVRLKAPLTGSTDYLDMVKGHISWPNQEMDDMILRRSDGSPTYNLAVVVDDHTMGITHVLRGEDHVANTPRQILIYNALGLTPPAFGHVPMILGPDKKKLSKRHGATSVIEYEKDGILPEAMLNYLARLGWSHGDQEIFSREELIEHFNTEPPGDPLPRSLTRPSCTGSTPITSKRPPLNASPPCCCHSWRKGESTRTTSRPLPPWSPCTRRVPRPLWKWRTAWTSSWWMTTS